MVIIDGREYEWNASTTIAELLTQVGSETPCYLVELNKQYIFRSEFDVTVVPDNSVLITIPIIGGG